MKVVLVFPAPDSSLCLGKYYNYSSPLGIPYIQMDDLKKSEVPELHQHAPISGEKYAFPDDCLSIVAKLCSSKYRIYWRRR